MLKRVRQVKGTFGTLEDPQLFLQEHLPVSATEEIKTKNELSFFLALDWAMVKFYPKVTAINVKDLHIENVID